MQKKLKSLNPSQRLKQILCFFLFTLGFYQTVFASRPTPLLNFLNQSTNEHKRNHQLCFAYEDSSPGLPCNPAFLGFQRPSATWFYSYGNHNLDYFEDVANVINGPVKMAEILPLIDHNSTQNFQFGSSLGYSTENWGFNLIPAKLVLFTNIRNPALPRISVLAARESELQFQMGSFWDKEWAWGLQLRGIHRRFSYNDSFLTDQFTEPSEVLYPVRTQNLVLLEPSLIYAPESVDGKPIFTLMVSNLGGHSGTLAPFDTDPKIHLGVSFETALDTGKFKGGLLTQWVHQEEQEKFYPGIGFDYEISSFNFLGTLSDMESQIGLAYTFKAFTAGIVYSEQDWNHTPSSESQSLWRWDLGFQF